MHHFVVRFSNFLHLRRQGGIDPPNQNPADVPAPFNNHGRGCSASSREDVGLTLTWTYKLAHCCCCCCCCWWWRCTEWPPSVRVLAFLASVTEHSMLHHHQCRLIIRIICSMQHTHGWRRGVVVSGVRRMNEVNARRARLLPQWVTDFGRVYNLGM